MIRRWRAAALVLLASLACLGSAPVAQDGSDPLTAEQREWSESHGPIRVGWIEDLPPVTVIEDGVFVGGWGYELLELAALKVAVDLEPVGYPDPGAATRALAAGEIDVLGIAGPRPDLLAIAESTEPFGWAPTVLVVGDSRPDAADVSDLAGATVTTIPGSPLVAQLEESYPDLVYVETSDIPSGIAAAAAGEIDAYFGPLAVIGYALQQQGGRDLRPVGEAATVVATSSWALPSSPALAIMRTARSQLSADEMRLIHVRWTGFDLTEPGADGLPVWVTRGLVVAGGVIVILSTFTLVLRRRVASATAELRRYHTDLEGLVAERTDQLAEANARLSDSNDALLGFAGSVAHDLRGPLAATAGLAEALRAGMLEGYDQDEVLARIEVASRRSAELVADMLQAASDGPIEPGAIEAVDLERWLRDLLAPELDEHGATLSFSSSAASIGLPSQPTRQLLANLVGNALKHAGGAPKIEVSVDRSRGQWVVAVDDDGPGVPEADRERIFQRGIQLSESSEGEGMGLAACRALVAELGGDLTYRRSALGGARFLALVPEMPVTVTAATAR